jgi:hypothetical protein
MRALRRGCGNARRSWASRSGQSGGLVSGGLVWFPCLRRKPVGAAESGSATFEAEDAATPGLATATSSVPTLVASVLRVNTAPACDVN